MCNFLYHLFPKPKMLLFYAQMCNRLLWPVIKELAWIIFKIRNPSSVSGSVEENWRTNGEHNHFSSQKGNGICEKRQPLSGILPTILFLIKEWKMEHWELGKGSHFQLQLYIILLYFLYVWIWIPTDMEICFSFYFS